MELSIRFRSAHLSQRKVEGVLWGCFLSLRCWRKALTTPQIYHSNFENRSFVGCTNVSPIWKRRVSYFCYVSFTAK